MKKIINWEWFQFHNLWVCVFVPHTADFGSTFIFKFMISNKMLMSDLLLKFINKQSEVLCESLLVLFYINLFLASCLYIVFLHENVHQTTYSKSP